MNIVYKELTGIDDFNQCIKLQKSIFNFSDINVISPLFLRLIARNNPPIGIALGVFRSEGGENELIGIAIGFATFLQRSIDTVIIGIIPEFQNRIYGYKLVKKYIEIAQSKNIEFFYAVVDPLDANIARFDISYFGYIGYKYEIDKNVSVGTENKATIPDDKLLIRWDLNIQKMKDQFFNKKVFNKKEAIKKIPLATHNNLPDSQKVLVNIPEDFAQLKINQFEEAKEWRIKMRHILTEYINTRNYTISHCFSLKVNRNRRTYYLLEKELNLN